MINDDTQKHPKEVPPVNKQGEASPVVRPSVEFHDPMGKFDFGGAGARDKRDPDF